MEEELPDIPYTPIRDASYDEAGTSTSSTGNEHKYGATYIPDYLQVPLTRNGLELPRLQKGKQEAGPKNQLIRKKRKKKGIEEQ